MKQENYSKQLDWLCYHLVTENILSVENCFEVIQAIEEGGMAITPDLFVQVLVDNQVCTDTEKLNAILQMIDSEVETVGVPPESIFTDHPLEETEAFPSETDGLPDEIPQEEESGDLVPPDPPEIEVTGEWMTGWPVLRDAENMTREQARELMIAFLEKAREEHCSDVHVVSMAVPFVRRYKILQLLPGQPVLSPKAAEMLNLAVLTEAQEEKFKKDWDLDYGLNVTDSDRYRVNVMYQRLGISGSYRVVDNHIPTIAELGFKKPEVIEKLTTYGQGLILVTGPAGSGKSMTLNALINHLNMTRQDHVITVEDPIEVIHQPVGCAITQRELNTDTKSFGNALRGALREDPDIIVIGEMRDLETIEMAIHSSETGHLVIGTLHTSSAADTMSRLLDVFPAGQQAQIRAMVAESLRGIICQQLVPNADGTGCCLAVEILLGTLAVSNLIRENKTYQLQSTLQTAKNLGMCTMEQSYFDLYQEGKRTFEQTAVKVKNAELRKQMAQIEATRTAEAAGPKKKKGWF